MESIERLSVPGQLRWTIGCGWLLWREIDGQQQRQRKHMSGPVLTTEVPNRTARRIGSGQTEESEALGASLWYMEAWSPPSAQARRDYSGAFLPQWQSKHP